MRENTGADLSAVMEIATAAARFDWTWTAADATGLATAARWIDFDIQHDGPEITVRGWRADEHAAFKVLLEDDDTIFCVMVEVVDPDASNEPDRVNGLFEDLDRRLRTALGLPTGVFGGLAQPCWLFPKVAIALHHTDTTLCLFVESRERYERSIRRAAEYAAAVARQTDWSAFLSTIPLLARANPGSWSRAEMTRILGTTGWQIEHDDYFDDHIARLRSDAAWIELRARTTPEDLRTDRFGFGEFRGLRLTQWLSAEVGDAAYRAALAECARYLGAPSWVGGPGAQAIWRRPDVTIELSRSDEARSHLRLEVSPTGPAEDYRRWLWTWSDEWRPEDRWRATPNDTDPSLHDAIGADWRFPETSASSWSDLENYLGPLFESLAADLPVLQPFTDCVVWSISSRNESEGWLMQGWFRETDCRLEFREPEGLPRMLDYPPGRESGQRIAEAVMTTLRHSGFTGPDQLRHGVFVPSQKQRLLSFRLGLSCEP